MLKKTIFAPFALAALSALALNATAHAVDDNPDPAPAPTATVSPKTHKVRKKPKLDPKDAEAPTTHGNAGKE